ncbi:MAG: insulinase family protein, partial [Deltaproteobacteria bacterium]|nr:insulinase family protein [Deltaproteobacteria bacterium]
GQEGLAQLTGHLMRRGPRGLSQERFEERLASLGARVSVEVSMRSTRIRATVLRRNLQPLLGLVADVVWQPALRTTDFAKLKRRTQAALIARLDDDQTLGAVCFREALFGEHPYGRTLSGDTDSLARIGIQQVKDFYARHVAKGVFLVGVAGDVSEVEVRSLIASHFPKARRATKKGFDVPATHIRRGRHVVIVDKPERTQTQLFIGTLGARTRDRNLFPLIVSNTAFGGTFSGPLMQQVRGVRGWSYGAYSRLLHSTQRDAWYSTEGRRKPTSTLPSVTWSTATVSIATHLPSASKLDSMSSSWISLGATWTSTISSSPESPGNRLMTRRGPVFHRGISSS